MSSSPTVSDATFENEVLQAAGPVLVDFYAEWCRPCKAMSPIIDELAGTMSGKLKIVKMNIDESPNAPTTYGVRGVPTFMIFKDGKVVDQRVGGMSKSQFAQWAEGAL